MDGEWLQFRVHYGFFNASEIEIELKKKKLDGVSVFHAKGYGRSTGLLRFFFKVEDYYESFEKDRFPLTCSTEGCKSYEKSSFMVSSASSIVSSDL